MGSRIEKFSSIIKRCEGLMKGGVMKKKPIWYDVYVKHPPFEEPTFSREQPDMPVNEIFYAEDIQRAKNIARLESAKTGYREKRPKRNQFKTEEKRDENRSTLKEINKDLSLFDELDETPGKN